MEFPVLQRIPRKESLMKHPARLSRLGVILLLAAASALPLTAAPAELAGHWEGAIALPSMKLEIKVDFAKQADGAWKGDISIPAQNIKDMALADIKTEGTAVSFEIPTIPGGPAFSGSFSADGATISGDFTQGGQKFPFELTRGADPIAKAKKALEGFDDVVIKGLEQIKVPGTAVAVVKDNEVVYAKGFGFRDLEKKLPMTADTLMAIGSCTKAFTTFALGTLVDQGKVEWDKPVRSYIPWFRLYDVVAGERLTPRDLVTHRSGLPRHDLVWYNNATATREDLVRRLAFLPPSADIRVKWQYNNLMFLTAGYLVETLTGKPWENSVRSLVFSPLEMTRSNFSVVDSQKDSDFAEPYVEREGKLTRWPFRNITTMGPAGSINSSVNEMAHWVMVHINNGKYKGRQVIEPATVNDMHAAYMPTGATSTRPDISPADYGLGWFIDTYRGHQRVEHGGNIDGFSALVCLYPNDGLGFVVLTNKNGTPFPELVAETAADRIFGLEAIDWIGEAAKEQAEGRAAQKAAEQKKATRRRAGTTPSHKLEEYAGDYWNPGYGDLKVGLKANQLLFTYNAITTPLEHWHYDTFNGMKADDPTFQDMKLTFRTDVNGNVAAIAAPFEPTLDEIVFAKKPDAKLSDPDYLKKVVGTYQLMSQTITVGMRGDSLTMTVPGQPIYDLVPELGGEYSLKQAKIVSLKFVEDAKGQVTGIEVYQPSGVFEAKRIKS
jgi:CubicO group peptidase (beta-lactamase class C family)